MLSAYIPIFLFLLVAIAFVIVVLRHRRGSCSPPRYNKVKLEPYECGIEPQTDARDRYSIRYYLVAMLFVIFDVETVFMFPWAVIMDQLAWFGLIEMLVFLAILVVGLRRMRGERARWSGRRTDRVSRQPAAGR